MSAPRHGGRIAVGNLQLDGVQSAEPLPTFLLTVIGLGPEQIEHELLSVAYLQAMAPVFRVVVATDRPLLQQTRMLGWPIEHFVAPEHRSGVVSADAHASYLGQRLAIAAAHYQNLVVLDRAASVPFARLISLRLQLGGLDEVARALAAADSPPPQSPQCHTWEEAATALQASGHCTFSGLEGRVELSTDGPPTAALFLAATGSDAPAAPAPLETPSWVSTVRLAFEASATRRFESAVYSSLAQVLQPDLVVVQPWRADATHAEDVLYWADLVVERHGQHLTVDPVYREAYQVLVGTEVLRWDGARLYARARRVSRTLSRWRGAP